MAVLIKSCTNFIGGYSITSVHPSSSANVSAFGQCFTMPSDKYYKLTNVQFYGYRYGSPSICKAYLYSKTNGYPASLLAQSDNIAGTSFGTSYTWVSFPFSGDNQVILEPSIIYFIVFVAYSGTWNGNNNVTLAYGSCSGYAVWWNYNGWHSGAPYNDCNFRLYGNEYTPPPPPSETKSKSILMLPSIGIIR